VVNVPLNHKIPPAQADLLVQNLGVSHQRIRRASLHSVNPAPDAITCLGAARSTVLRRGQENDEDGQDGQHGDYEGTDAGGEDGSRAGTIGQCGGVFGGFGCLWIHDLSPWIN